MGKKGLSPGHTQISISIPKELVQLMQQNGVTKRKYGKKISELIRKEYEKPAQENSSVGKEIEK